MTHPVDFDMRNDETVRCHIKDGWEAAGQEGEYFGNFHIKGRLWALVLMDDEDNPTLMKAESLKIAETVWKDIK